MDKAIMKQITGSIPTIVIEGDTSKPEFLPSSSIFASPYSTFRIDRLADYERASGDSNKEYFNPDEYDLFFFCGINDDIKEISFSEMSLEDDKLSFSTDRLGFETLSNLSERCQLRNHILLARHYEFNVFEYCNIYEDGVSKLFGISNKRDFYLENVKKDYVNTLVFNIRNFNNILSYFNEEILRDEKFIDYKKMYIKNLKKEMDNFLKLNSLDFLYYEGDIEDEYFFYIAKFYGNIDYLPNILKEDYKEICGG